jgi:uracil-DNA glycosylase
VTRALDRLLAEIRACQICAAQLALGPRPVLQASASARLLPLLKNVQLTLLIGQYAQVGMLGVPRGAKLTDTVRAWRDYLPLGKLPLPHPSPRNRPWVMHNLWFEAELLPVLRKRVAAALRDPG